MTIDCINICLKKNDDKETNTNHFYKVALHNLMMIKIASPFTMKKTVFLTIQFMKFLKIIQEIYGLVLIKDLTD